MLLHPPALNSAIFTRIYAAANNAHIGQLQGFLPDAFVLARAVNHPLCTGVRHLSGGNRLHRPLCAGCT